MKLAEALARRSDALKRVEQLRARIKQNATYQEGTEAAEDANALIVEAGLALTELEGLIKRINLTNAQARLADGRTITDALASRDVLKMRHSLLVHAADAGLTEQRGWGRTTHSELATLSAVDVKALRSRADEVAAELRKLDLAIQETNWLVDLAN
jgi:hypothetical protein